MTVTSVSLLERIWLSWVCGFRILFDAAFAARVAALREAAAAPEALPLPAESPKVVAAPVAAESLSSTRGALQLLSLLQREGRFIDFVQQEVTGFGDADIGAAARLVHEGCRRALHDHARVVSVRNEAEGSRLTIERASADLKLVGNVSGSAPFRGVLRHRGWRVVGLSLPRWVGEQDPEIVAQAELELS